MKPEVVLFSFLETLMLIKVLVWVRTQFHELEITQPTQLASI